MSGHAGNIHCPSCGSRNVECVEKPRHDHRCHDCGNSVLPRSARQTALKAMLAPFAEGDGDDVARAVTLGEALDAIPADVLAQLAADRGGLVHIDSWHDARCDRDGAKASCWHPVGTGCSQERVGRIVPAYMLSGDVRRDGTEAVDP